jgi:hypothetical protein
MPSTHTHKATATRTAPAKGASGKSGRAAPAKKAAASAASSGDESWLRVQKLLDETEHKLASLEKAVDTSVNKTVELSIEKMDDFEAQWLKALSWMQAKAAKLKTFEAKTEQLVDETRVKTKLAKMEAQDFIHEMVPYVDRIKNKIDGIVAKSSDESGKTLQRLSDACLKLKNTLER